MEKKDRVQFTARMPTWFREWIEPELLMMGAPTAKKDGSKLVTCAALWLYMSLPEKDRRRLARVFEMSDEHMVRQTADAHWLTQVIRAVTSQGEDAARRILGRAEVLQAGPKRGRSESTHPPASADHSGRRRGTAS